MADPTLTPLSPKLSQQTLKRYMEAFIDPERMSFHTFAMLEKLRRNKGYRSSGYELWNYYATERPSRPYIISEATFASYVHKLDEVLVYWDRAYVDPASPFAQPSGICAARYPEIAAHMELCPPTLYIFDRTFKWSLARTDEPLNETDWNCLQIGEIGSSERPGSPAAMEQSAGKVIPLKRKASEQM